MKVKLFSSWIEVYEDQRKLEKIINTFIEEKDVIDMKFSSSSVILNDEPDKDFSEEYYRLSVLITYKD